jgi:hypothetical protein
VLPGSSNCARLGFPRSCPLDAAPKVSSGPAPHYSPTVNVPRRRSAPAAPAPARARPRATDQKPRKPPGYRGPARRRSPRSLAVTVPHPPSLRSAGGQKTEYHSHKLPSRATQPRPGPFHQVMPAEATRITALAGRPVQQGTAMAIFVKLLQPASASARGKGSGE